MIGHAAELARAHAPLLMLLAPLSAAALALAAPWARLAWALAVVGLLVSAGLGLWLAGDVLLGGAPLPRAQEGAALRLDGVAAFAAPLVAALGALVLIAAGAVLDEFEPRAASLAVALTAAAAAGWIGALLAQDLAAVFLAAEAAWLAGVGVTAMSPQRGALNGALRMLTTGGVAAALFLLGLALMARAAGVTELSALSISRLASPPAAAAGAGLMLLALAAKAGVAPLHAWAGAAFGRSGRMALLCLGAVSAVGALAVLVRVAAHVVPAPQIGEGVSLALAGLGAASVIVGSLQAVGATSLPRLAAYAIAAQAGISLVTLGLGSPAAFAAVLVQMLGLGAAALALVGGIAAGGAQTFASLDGLGRRSPLAGAAITAAALNLMSAPLTIGFLGRWRLIEAGVGAGWWWASGAVILASLAGVFYGGRLIERLYFRRAGETYGGARGLWNAAAFAPALIAAIAVTLIGLAPGAVLDAAATAAALALGGA